MAGETRRHLQVYVSGSKQATARAYLTRDSAIPVLNSVTVAPITSTIRSIPTEVILTTEDGLPEICAANFDNIQTVPKANISAAITHLSVLKLRAAAGALGFID